LAIVRKSRGRLKSGSVDVSVPVNTTINSDSANSGPR
jgi:hypothetical protein